MREWKWENEKNERRWPKRGWGKIIKKTKLEEDKWREGEMIKKERMKMKEWEELEMNKKRTREDDQEDKVRRR